MQNIKDMTTRDINLRMEELREYETTDATIAEFAALWDERQVRYLADAAVAAERMMRNEVAACPVCAIVGAHNVRPLVSKVYHDTLGAVQVCEECDAQYDDSPMDPDSEC